MKKKYTAFEIAKGSKEAKRTRTVAPTTEITNLKPGDKYELRSFEILPFIIACSFASACKEFKKPKHWKPNPSLQAMLFVACLNKMPRKFNREAVRDELERFIFRLNLFRSALMTGDGKYLKKLIEGKVDNEGVPTG
jgi:hypothetical protein